MKKIAVILLVGAALIAVYAAATTPNAAPVQTGTVGRYQLVLNPNVRADVFLLDTQTGRIWTSAEITNVSDGRTKSGSPTVWVYQERVDNKTDWEKFVETHPPKEKPE